MAMRKGIFYTLLVVIFLSVIMIVFATYNKYSLHDKQEIYESRIRTMNDFLTDFSADIPRAVHIGTFRAMLAMEEQISQTGLFISNKSKMEEMFKEAFNNGTINGAPFEIMNESHFQSYLARINNKSRQIDIILDATVTDINLTQQNPWYLNVSFKVHVNVSDARGLASWIYEEYPSVSVPIDDLKDPLYTVYTNGKLPNTVRRANYTMYPFVNDTNDANITIGFLRFVNESFYINSTRAPSILQRFYGDLNPSPYGIESVIRLDRLNKQDEAAFPVKAYLSSIDYIYFNETESEHLVCKIQGISQSNLTFPWLVLDRNHTGDYGFVGTLCSSNITTGGCTGAPAPTCPS